MCFDLVSDVRVFNFSEIGSLKFDTRDRAIRREPHSERCATNDGGCHETDYIWHVGLTSIWSISGSHWGVVGTSLKVIGFFNDDWVCSFSLLCALLNLYFYVIAEEIETRREPEFVCLFVQFWCL